MQWPRHGPTSGRPRGRGGSAQAELRAALRAGPRNRKPIAPALSATAAAVAGGLRLSVCRPSSSDRRAVVVAAAVERLVADFDFEHGGWGGPPRFPQPAVIDLLLRRARAVRTIESGTAIRALDVMADGGIHDQIGGGFHRYATDTDWLVPHFEKMLYDNAQLARVYLHAYQLTGEPRFRNSGRATLDYLVREMRTSDGLFAASQDADTDGVEGRTYVWTLDEVAAVLGGTVGDARRISEARSRAAGRGARSCRALRLGVWRHRRRQLGGPDDPLAGDKRRAGGRPVWARRAGGCESAGTGPPPAARAAK